MAMIACPVCDKQISDQAPLCPGCGHPLQPPRKCRCGWLIGCGCLLAAFFTFLLTIIIALLIWIGCSVSPLSDEELDSDPAMAETVEQHYRCRTNLEEIALLKEEWATAHDAKKGAVIPDTDVEKLFAESAKKLVCPNDAEHSFQTSYEVGPIGTDPLCKCDEKHNEADEDEK